MELFLETYIFIYTFFLFTYVVGAGWRVVERKLRDVEGEEGWRGGTWGGGREVKGIWELAYGQ